MTEMIIVILIIIVTKLAKCSNFRDKPLPPFWECTNKIIRGMMRGNALGDILFNSSGTNKLIIICTAGFK